MHPSSRPPGTPGPSLTRIAVWLVLVTVLSVAVVTAVTDRDGALNNRLRQVAQAYLSPNAPGGSEPSARPAPASAAYQTNREITLRKQADGHFYVQVEVNGYPIDFLVDSGATHVVLTQADAETAGLRPGTLRYTGRSQTANGVATFATVQLRQLRVEQFVVRDINAAVIDSPLGISLLGMGFLSQLEEFSVVGDRLIMRY